MPIVCVTAYTAPMAELLDPHVDLLLVGDSLGMVLHGMPSTVGVTLEMMILHGQAVMRGANRALVVVDMPFGSYEASKEQAFHSAARILKETHCGAVKLEAGRTYAYEVLVRHSPTGAGLGGVNLSALPPVIGDPLEEAIDLAATADLSILVVGTNDDDTCSSSVFSAS